MGVGLDVDGALMCGSGMWCKCYQHEAKMLAKKCVLTWAYGMDMHVHKLAYKH